MFGQHHSLLYTTPLHKAAVQLCCFTFSLFQEFVIVEPRAAKHQNVAVSRNKDSNRSLFTASPQFYQAIKHHCRLFLRNSQISA